MQVDIVVVGGGPAGLAAAIEAKKHGCDSILVIDREPELGGILQQCIHSGFGLHIFQEELTGPEYAERFIRRLEAMHIDYLLHTTVLEITGDKMVYAAGPGGFYSIQANAIILAMGCRERTRDAIQIPGARPAGIITAGSAQRLINIEGYMIGKKVVILGSGDIGLIMARRLTLEGAQVQAVLEVMPYPGGLMRNIVQCLDDFAIPLLLNHTIIDIEGRQRVEKVVVAEVDQAGKPLPGTERTMECDTVLLSVGLIPENELSMHVHIQIDPVTLGPLVNEAMETSSAGVFACGNVLHVHDLVDYVTEEAQKAGKNAAQYIKGLMQPRGTAIRIKAGKGVRHVVPQHIRAKNTNGDIQLLTCLVCPMGCRMEAEKVSSSDGEYMITGCQCSRGEIYALQELTNPIRMLTTTMKIKNAIAPRIAVRTAAPIPKQLIRKCINFLNGLEVEAPVQMGEAVVKDILGTGVDVIAPRSIG